MKAVRLFVLIALVAEVRAGFGAGGVHIDTQGTAWDNKRRAKKGLPPLKAREVQIREDYYKRQAEKQAEAEAAAAAVTAVSVEETEEKEHAALTPLPDDMEEVLVEEGLITKKQAVIGAVAVGAGVTGWKLIKRRSTKSSTEEPVSAAAAEIAEPVPAPVPTPVPVAAEPEPEPVAEVAQEEEEEPVVVEVEEEVAEEEVMEEEVAEEEAVAEEEELVEEEEVSSSDDEEEPASEGEEEEQPRSPAAVSPGGGVAARPGGAFPLPSTAHVAPGGAKKDKKGKGGDVAEPEEAAVPAAEEGAAGGPPMEVAEADAPAGELPQTVFRGLFGEHLVEQTGAAGQLKKVHTAARLAGKTVAVLFHANQFEKMLREKGLGQEGNLLKRLGEAYGLTRAAGHEFEIVYVGLDKEAGDFAEVFDGMPWLALPQDAPVERKQGLVSLFEIDSFPAVAVLGPDGKLINPKAMTSIITDPEGFPWAPIPLREAIGEEFVDSMGNTYDKAAVEDKVVGLYFSAHWCPPCQQFTPLLKKTYEDLKAQGKELEIVYVSSDKTEEEFNKYLGAMPWVAVPYDDVKRRTQLQVGLGVNGLPTLILVDKDGSVINRNGRSAVAADPAGADFPWRPKAVKNLSQTTEEFGEGPAIIVFAEGASAEEAEQVAATLAPISERTRGEGKAFKFYYAPEPTQVTGLLRKMCALPDAAAPGDKPVLAVLDLETKLFAVADGEVTAEGVEQFLKGIEDQTLALSEIDVSRLQAEGGEEGAVPPPPQA